MEVEMISVTVELIPGGYAPLKRTIGTLRIANVSELSPVSDYEVGILEAANPLCGTPARIARIRIEGHERAQSVWVLIARAIAALDTADFVEL
jgi:hypothetical protein